MLLRMERSDTTMEKVAIGLAKMQLDKLSYYKNMKNERLLLQMLLLHSLLGLESSLLVSQWLLL